MRWRRLETSSNVEDRRGTGGVVTFWGIGYNQSMHRQHNTMSIVNLHLLTGNIGRPGTGANSITGQCNAMGSRLFSNTTNLLGGHAADGLGLVGLLGRHLFGRQRAGGQRPARPRRRGSRQHVGARPGGERDVDR